MIGDQLLVGIARRLETCLRPGDTVARVGGDEFTILLEDMQEETEAISIAERIQKEISVPFNLNGREVFTTVSIGIAPSSLEYVQSDDILRDADTAMYRAKTLGKARHEVFDKAMHAVAMNLLQMETDLRRALERQEFFIQYQPIVALDNFNLRGFEALVRWQHPERGLISPMDFIPVAEDTGQILPIGQWALQEACRQMRRWQRRFPSDPPLFISVNLSSRQFTQPNLIEQVKEILDETKLDPRSLKLEITESVVMENIDTATEMLKQLRALGVQLSIDDFGTGYSSLSYLHRFPIDTLKVDRSFVMRMVDNNENIEIVRTILMLAQNLGMDVVAEGVETKEQLALLRKLGCENGQGYFFSRPVSVGGAEKIISDTYAHAETSPDVQNNVRPIRPAMVA
jgi:EAL domain-containing protein (putative c-di-GMP-specific phosphodiesterase class I)